MCCDCSMFNVVCIVETLRAQTLMVQVARRSASVLKRRKSRNRMEHTDRSQDVINDSIAADSNITKSEVDGGDVVFYMEEPQSGKLTFILNVFSLIFQTKNLGHMFI